MYNLTSDIIPLALTGDKLIEAIKSLKNTRKVYAEGLLYENTTLLISADPGVGKSTIAIQAAVELSTGLPVFGYFQVPQPIKVLYILWERSIMETIERLQIIYKTYNINPNNLVITDEYQKINIVRYPEIFLKCIQRDCPNVNFIIIDPIYSTNIGGFKDEKPVLAFNYIMSTIQKALQCSIWFIHHTSKAQYAQDGTKIERNDPSYGSVFLKAFVSGSYYLKESEKGVTLTCTKDNYRLLTKSIELEYDQETTLSHLADLSKLPVQDRLNQFLEAKKIQQKGFYFEDILAETKVCIRATRAYLASPQFLERVNIEKQKQGKLFYTLKNDKTEGG